MGGKFIFEMVNLNSKKVSDAVNETFVVCCLNFLMLLVFLHIYFTRERGVS